MVDMYYGSAHEIVDDVELPVGYKLHRYINTAGVPYSAIYIGNFEILFVPREHEQVMIDAWNEFVRRCFSD